jgi:hypothetical protein
LVLEDQWGLGDLADLSGLEEDLEADMAVAADRADMGAADMADDENNSDTL